MTKITRWFLGITCWKTCRLLVVAVVICAASLSAVFAEATIYTDPTDFEAATQQLGLPTVIDFDELDASPINNTFEGRDPFDGNSYAGQGITFLNPNSYPMYISPGGLFWNASNSLSVGRFPCDPYKPNIFHEDDDLLVTLDPPCAAIGFTLVDNGSRLEDEFVQFIDSHGDIVEQVGLPSDFTSYRAFVGIVSLDRPIAMVNIVEAPDDGDDVNYDDFVLFPVLLVDVDIKPGSYPNSINLGSKGVVPVAVLTTGDFDASTVDPVTVQFADAFPLRWVMEDVDHDGDLDLLFHFKTQELNLDMNSTEATLIGETFDGMPIQGMDTVKIVP